MKKRNEIKRHLLMREDFIKGEYFRVISQSKEQIQIRDLVEFVRVFANTHLRNDEIEAILRRVDHSADQVISFEEFCEIVSSNEHNIKNSEDMHKVLNETASKDLRQTVHKSPLRRSPSKNEQCFKTID